jgi:hypothetical protein
LAGLLRRREGAHHAPIVELSEGEPMREDGNQAQGQEGSDAEGAFEFGEGYIGGRGYGGTSYDYSHGYRVSNPRTQSSRPRTAGRAMPQPLQGHSPATRGSYEWGEELRVNGGMGHPRFADGPYRDRLARQRRTDEELQREVEDALFYDTWVDADAITVKVDDGVVRLSGTLVSYEEVRYATDDAWEVDGVRGVRAELDVDESRSAPGANKS